MYGEDCLTSAVIALIKATADAVLGVALSACVVAASHSPAVGSEEEIRLAMVQPPV